MKKIFIIPALLLVLVSVKSLAADLLRDPTQPSEISNESSNDASEYVLNAIFISDNSQMAVISDKTYHVGDTIGIYKITTIDDNSVELTGKTGRKVLRLVENKIKVSF
jgi:hypothetical protein